MPFEYYLLDGWLG